MAELNKHAANEESSLTFTEAWIDFERTRFSRAYFGVPAKDVSDTKYVQNVALQFPYLVKVEGDMYHIVTGKINGHGMVARIPQFHTAEKATPLKIVGSRTIYINEPRLSTTPDQHPRELQVFTFQATESQGDRMLLCTFSVTEEPLMTVDEIRACQGVWRPLSDEAKNAERLLAQTSLRCILSQG